ncbi:hypothetical protein FCV25MIE_30690 [Fagus crenata]
MVVGFDRDRDKERGFPIWWWGLGYGVVALPVLLWWQWVVCWWMGLYCGFVVLVVAMAMAVAVLGLVYGVAGVVVVVVGGLLVDGFGFRKKGGGVVDLVAVRYGCREGGCWCGCGCGCRCGCELLGWVWEGMG